MAARVPEQDVKHRRPHPQTMAAPFLEFDLERELEQLYREPEWDSGQNAKTLAKYSDFRIVLTALKAHMRIPRHQTAGRVSIQTVRGHVVMRAEGRTLDLPLGRLVTFDRSIAHEIEAVDESAILITIAWPSEREPQTASPATSAA
jgi:quercetin dioxygenase-like cupin family protein